MGESRGRNHFAKLTSSRGQGASNAVRAIVRDWPCDFKLSSQALQAKAGYGCLRGGRVSLESSGDDGRTRRCE